MWSLAPGARLTISTPGNHFELGSATVRTISCSRAGSGSRRSTPWRSRWRNRARTSGCCMPAAGGRILRWPTTCAPPSATGSHVFVDDEGARIDLAAEFAALAPGGEVYVCGPIGMLEAAKRTWQATGRPMEQLRFETFGNSGRFATSAFEVKIPRLGLEIVVPQGQTMLEALEEAGVEMIFDCGAANAACAPSILSWAASWTIATCSSARRKGGGPSSAPASPASRAARSPSTRRIGSPDVLCPVYRTLP